jgi:hypothetical protein
MQTDDSFLKEFSKERGEDRTQLLLSHHFRTASRQLSHQLKINFCDDTFSRCMALLFDWRPEIDALLIPHQFCSPHLLKEHDIYQSHH